MVTISRDTLSVSLIEFLRDLLRNNLTHPDGSSATWIFKDNPAEDIDADDFPRVLIEDAGQNFDQIGLTGELRVPKDLSVNITVYTFDIYTRDTIADQIHSILNTYTYATSVATGSETMKTMLLTLKSISSSTNDIYAEYPKPYRIKEINCVFRYRGG